MSSHDHVRVYSSIRTAHLERLPTLIPARLVYGGTRYDFDESLIDESNRPLRLGRVATIVHLLTNRYDVVEINEPFMTARWIDLALQIVAVRTRGRFARRSTRIVTYALSLKDPIEDIARRRYVPRRFAPWLTRRCLRSLVRHIDRIAFGTSAAYELMADVVPESLLRSKARVVPALSSRCPCVTEDAVQADRSASVLFVGAFADRKGVPELMDAWAHVTAVRPDVELAIIGTGPLLAQVREFAGANANVNLVVDPPRSEIHDALRAARVLVLPSRRVGLWREQVGLPILEGLAHGVHIVTTDETGLADWLGAHGHTVLDAPVAPQELGAAIRDALGEDRSAAAVLADLPAVDGRVAADRWMFTGEVDDHLDPARVTP